MNTAINAFLPDPPAVSGKAKRRKRGIYRHPTPPQRGLAVHWWTMDRELPKGRSPAGYVSDAEWKRRLTRIGIREVNNAIYK